MDARESLVMVLNALHELKKQHTTRTLVIDFVRGQESREITELGWDKLELFGCGDKREDVHYNMVVDQAVEEKYIKETDGILKITQKGEKFRKASTPFMLKEDNDDEEPNSKDNDMLNSLVESALKDGDDEDDELALALAPNPATQRSQQMIHLIQAIDRKIPLDDYAEQMQLGFDEVLDNLERLFKQGVKVDIQYFIDEVLEKECQDELNDYFDEVNGDVERAIEEFDGAYQPEEIRLARLVWNRKL